MLVGHHVVFVLRVGRLVAIRHVDEIVRQLGGAVEFLSKAHREERGLVFVCVITRRREREHRGGGGRHLEEIGEVGFVQVHVGVRRIFGLARGLVNY